MIEHHHRKRRHRRSPPSTTCDLIGSAMIAAVALQAALHGFGAAPIPEVL
jgi:hypothetical protein